MTGPKVDLKFGTSGLRGLAVDLDRETCAAYVRAFIAMLRREGEGVETLCLASDLRPSSPAIAAHVAAAGAACGVAVVNGGNVPTPALARYALRRGLPAIMVTASHNPAGHNGLKFYRPGGELRKTDEAPILALLGDAGAAPTGPEPLPGAIPGMAAEYLESYVRLFGREALRGLRIGIDQHSAVGRDLLRAILESLGAECTTLRRSAEFIAVDTEALDPAYLFTAADWASAGSYDAIVSTDGDGDRPLVLDEQGTQVMGDTLGILAARYLSYDSVVTPVSSTSQVEASRWFAHVARTRIGSPYVIEAMEAALAAGHGAVAGFEGNGGFLTAGGHEWRGRGIEPLVTRDAVLPMVAVLAMARELRMPLSVLVRQLPRRSKATGRLSEIDMGLAQSWIDRLVASPDDRSRALPLLAATSSVETVDGAKFLLEDGSSLHLRLSGNAPELRCYVETTDAATSAALLTATLTRASEALQG